MNTAPLVLPLCAFPHWTPLRFSVQARRIKACRYDPGQRVGPRACPFTTLYWDFLSRHRALLAANPRMGFQVKNLDRLDGATREAIAERAAAIRRGDVGAGQEASRRQ